MEVTSMKSSDKYIEIGIGQEQHALRITDINEIIKIQPITKLPNSPADVVGICNLRGVIIPVLSLRAKFGLPEVEQTKATRIVVVINEDQLLGLVVDSVSRVISFTDIQPPPYSLSGDALPFVEGVGRAEDRMVMIMNLPNVLKTCI
jgi:purine-binding chemotaxis protein CheW